MNYPFYAMLHRMRNIHRWSLMRNTQSENIMEHSFEVAVLAHALALIRRQYYYEDGTIAPSPERCAVYALFHDAPEIITGDLPTPIKYHNSRLHADFAELEAEAGERLTLGVPIPLRDHYRQLLDPQGAEQARPPESLNAMPSGAESAEELAVIKAIVKIADHLAALIKCIDERLAGNREFREAEEATRRKLAGYSEHPELQFFLKNCLPAYELSLDEVQAVLEES